MGRIAKYYREYGIRIVKGFMQYVWDDKGQRYIDCNTNHGVVFLGHANPKIVEAVKKQVEEIWAVPLNFATPARERFIEEFSKLLPPKFGVVFLQNTGTEAVEVAIKIAKKVTRKPTIVAFTNSFHGRTMGSLSITWNEKYKKAFEPLYPHVRFGKFNVPHEVDKLIGEDTCCVVVEPIQGEGGVNPATPEFLKALREEAQRKGALLIFDEVQTGFGRTGAVWAFQKYGVEPDIFTAGKPVAGGLPIGLAVAREDFGDVFEPGEHGSTFAGNAVVMAAAAAASRLLREEDVPGRAERIGAELAKALGDTGSRLAVRVKGMGLMLGLELRVKADQFIQPLLERGVMALTAGVNTLRFLPPYMISKEDVEVVHAAVTEVLKKAEQQ
ncbi:aspartate aminotransferase family protein [Pyrobaculum aerophilum]|uniref:Putative [LysW]-aminoadipate semialdehyde/glutamate semialdehyde transaminase n=2 Tax=Pyrobaculum aerophilum TaxID=13773 RepID=LYSJ_PYRAE|nr:MULTISPECIES: aspartate aminotransferase family protein [Pyrobaculum]Q8ZV07.1 RecName: Full=Putative [LysW]-aminoadipate semialdehyde/glutamate semialdehyde transaminase [Pyrobaculum aerophilum str. IM2]AAL64249.1 acetylornithine aminotransferase (argD) [Pyrobaculum aerophilum str. IM2]MCX8135716.1 aspartate aminotransferase family protein [Pyrobaculum aerophilum]HII46995.1 aspartate aminotransferase family protein [Pyrobaculum aerophilum]